MRNPGDVLAFYSSHWREIGRESTFPPEIHQYLREQSRIFQHFCLNTDYDLVVEAGCMNGSMLLQPVIDLGLKYLGVDIACEAILEAQERVKKLSIPKRQSIELFCADITDLDQFTHLLSPEANILTVFPFNSFGNIWNPEKALEVLFGVGSDILIFTYDITDYANKIRSNYYQSCDVGAIKLVVDDLGTLFRSVNSLHAYAYRKERIEKWSNKTGYVVQTYSFSNIGMFYLLTQQLSSSYSYPG